MDAVAEKIVLARGGVRWRIEPGLAFLFGPDGPRLDEWLATGQAHIVKHGPHRTVYHVVLPEIDFYFKHNRLADYRAKLREWIRPSKARVEYRHARAVAARGIPTFEALAVGEPCRGTSARDSYLLTRALPETRPLNSFLEITWPQWPSRRQARLRQRIAAALARLLAQMHDAGVAHHDLHPGNLLLRLDADDRVELFLVDLHAVRIGAPLAWPARRANLILLNRWFLLRSQLTDRLRFWRFYESLTSPPSDAIEQLERGTLRSNLRLWHKLDRRSVQRNRHFRSIQSGEVSGHVAADVFGEALAALAAAPDEPFQRPDVSILKRSPSSAVVEFDLSTPHGPRRVVYKRFAVTRWSDPWAALFRPTPALRSYVMGHALRLRCLPTPRPLAVWHRHRFGLPREGYLLTEKVSDAMDLRAFVDSLRTLPPAECRSSLRRLLDQTAHLLATLHQRRLSHRDLKAANLLVSGASTIDRENDVSLHLIDLVGAGRPGKLRRERRAQNLARLNASFLNHPGVTRSDRLRFLRVYLRWGLRGRAGWKLWWRRIAEATARKVQRNLRNGRTLG